MNGVYVVLIGPFGAGKSSLAKALVNDHSGRFKYEVEKQITTRKLRPGEDDFEYKFVNEAEFEKNCSKYFRIQPNRGVPQQYALQQPTKPAKDKLYLYIVLPETAIFLRKNHSKTIVCAILPTSINDLKQLLKHRDKTITEEEINLRISHVESDIKDSKELADIVHFNKGSIEESAKSLSKKIAEYSRLKEKDKVWR